ncbi:CxC2 domain-containing protein [Mycena venus]|uniref:CxC2 domain-containing protein n=1 Tax=Mycena venus TaxID=2733690 RepID=A0A8H6XJ79_9AGAR|nr:CxC2 domain-containing protein [Mycena venus]
MHRSLPPKSTCNYLKAVNNQDKKKFKNMEITDIVNVQCSHVFVKASVNLQFGERYANLDLALAITICQKLAECYKGEVTFSFVDDDDIDGDDISCDSIDCVMSYDAVCQYSVNIVERFEKHEDLRDLVPIVKKLRWAVPALHIQGHQEDCMYKFATLYMTVIGHFHRETAEHYWPELNQIGTQVTQMSGGRRQDVIALNHNDWNFKKMARSFTLLLTQLCKVDIAFEKHHINFLVPAQLAIYEKMLANESAIVNGFIPRNKVAAFLNEGILIQAEQVKLEKLVAQKSRHFTQVLQREVETLQDTIQNTIVEWRKLQKSLMPAVETRLNQLAARPIHQEMLGLPSDFSAEDRLVLNLTAFEKEEAELRAGAVEDALMSVKLLVQTWVSLKGRKRKQDRGGYKNTISQKQINDTERYNVAAETLKKLGHATEEEYPELVVADTALKSRLIQRQLGDSAITDGEIWGQGAISSGYSFDVKNIGRGIVATSQYGDATPEGQGANGGGVGLCWSEKWMKRNYAGGWKKGDTIQWFHAEAEMERWREEVETLLADWRTTIRSFAMYKETWARLAELQNPADIGHIAYAKQKADMFSKRELEGQRLLPAHKTLGPKYGAIVKDDLDLVEFVMQRRSRHQAMLDAVLEAAKKEEANKQTAETEADEEDSSAEED